MLVSVDAQIQKALRLPTEPAPVAKLLGMQLASAGPGLATFTLDVDARHHNPMGSVHGGVICDLADAAMGYAVISTLAQDETFTTIELKVNFLRPHFAGALRCAARVESRGKTIVYVTANVLNAEEKSIARATSTNMVLKAADGADALHHKPR